ncbi:MAG: dehydrogenase [Planctomycetaceae bacterium]|jgi:predicted dehydrogenase|nr:dehydrogenase [Planctomycetaceae bacterium]MDP7276345.1 Gfo/Idh/MocA family oxidoreductase [Planctomycetaceae bacterium]
MTVRWGILGCGDVARRRVAGAIADDPDSRLLAACRRNGTALEQFCSDFGVDRGYTDEADLVGDADIDAVYIATPVNRHLDQTLACAAVGKHVLCEKPMAMSVEECDRMIAACETAGVRLGLAYYRRFYPVVDRIRDLVSEGRIGTVFSITAVTATPFTFTPGDDGYWRVVLEEGGGGALMDIGSHRLNLFLDLFGPIADVRGFCSTRAGDFAADDAALLTVRFESGVLGTLQCYFGVPVDPDEFVVVGTEGRLVATPLNSGHLVIETAGGVETESHPPSENFNLPLITDFVDAIRTGRAPRVDGHEGRSTNEVIERGYRFGQA